MVKIRLKREGRKKTPHYHIVIANSKSPRDGKFIEKVGVYNPAEVPKLLKVNKDLIKYWLATGAQPTKVVFRLLSKLNIVPEMSFNK